MKNTQSNNPVDTCEFGNAILPYEFIANNPASYIHEHLATLYFIAKEFNVNEVLEIGTGNGHSTLAFANAGCWVKTLDVDQCFEANQLFEADACGVSIDFEQIDSLSFEPPKNNKYGLIFIDGLHEYKQVKLELERFDHFVSKNGFIVLHDYTNFAHPGVQRACDEFAASHREYKIYRWFNCNGLYVMKKDDNYTNK